MTILDDRSEWPWISGRSELVRLVAVVHHQAIGSQREVAASLAGIDVFADMQNGKGLSWAEILDATHTALETTGREIAAARTVEEVEAARLRQETYERARSETVDALLATAHNVLKRGTNDGGWLVGYGRRSVAGELEVIPPAAWEAGAPDWHNWRLSVPEAPTWHGVRLVYLREADEAVRQAVNVDLNGGHGTASDRTARSVVPRRDLDRWYENRARTWPTNQRPPSRDDDLEAARAKFGERVTVAQVRETRGRLAPDAWKKGGAPKRNQ